MTTSAPAPADVLEKVDALGPSGTPVTTPEVADGFDCTPRTIYNRLRTLVTDGVLETKKVGANSRVWWRPARTDDPAERTTEEDLRGQAELDAFRVELTDAIRPVTDAVDIQQAAARVLGEWLDVDHVHYGEVLADGQTNRVLAGYHSDDADSAIGEHHLDDYGTYIAEGFRADETLVVDDYRALTDLGEAERSVYEQAGISACIGVPLHKAGELAAYFVVTESDPREWTDAEVELVEITADRTWETVQRAVAVAKLRDNEAWLSEILEQLPIAVGILNADGVFELQNDRMKELVSGDPLPSRDSDQRDGLIGTDDDGEHLPPEQWPGARALRGEDVSDGVEFCLERDETRWVSVAAVPFREDGTVEGAIVTADDITERKQVEQELRETRELLEIALDFEEMGVWELDLQTRESPYRSPRHDEIFGYGDPVDDWSLERALEHFHPDDRETVKERFDAALESGDWEFEARIVRTDGEERWIRAKGTFFYENGTPVRGVGTVQDITERKQAEEELSASQARFRNVFTNGMVPMGVWTDEGAITDANEALLEMLGYTQEELDAGELSWWDRTPPEYHHRDWEAITEVKETGSCTPYEKQFVHKDGYRIPAVIIGGELDDRQDRGIFLAVDLTERKEAEKALRESEAALERLNAATRELIDAEAATIPDRITQVVRRVLNVEYAALWRYDDQSGDLGEHAVDAAAGVDADAIEFQTDVSEQVWKTFIGTEVDVENDLDVGSAVASPVRSRAFASLGRHGVVYLGSSQADTFDERTVDLVETVAATIEAAWTRAEGEQELSLRNEELIRLNRLNTLIRGIDQALVAADEREGIEDAVCERLADSELYEFAWIGAYDRGDGTVQPRSWAGIDSSTVEKLSTTAGDRRLDPDPFMATIQTREMQVIADIATDTRTRPWREVALKRGARSCFSIPLTYEESVYGVLVVYGGVPAQRHHDMDVLTELGGTIAHAIAAVDNRVTHRMNSVTSLTLRTRATESPLCRLARATGAEISFAGLVSGSTETPTVLFIATGASPEELVAASEDVLAIRELVHVADREDGGLFKAHLSDPTLASHLLKYNASVRSLEIDATAATTVVDLPSSADVRAVVEGLRQNVPDIELLSRRTQTRSPEITGISQTAVLDRLTPRQQEVLQLSYRSGYFESPRVQTGKDLADVLGISPSTFTDHIRSAERRLMDVVFASGRD